MDLFKVTTLLFPPYFNYQLLLMLNDQSNCNYCLFFLISDCLKYFSASTDFLTTLLHPKAAHFLFTYLESGFSLLNSRLRLPQQVKIVINPAAFALLSPLTQSKIIQVAIFSFSCLNLSQELCAMSD